MLIAPIMLTSEAISHRTRRSIELIQSTNILRPTRTRVGEEVEPEGSIFAFKIFVRMKQIFVGQSGWNVSERRTSSNLEVGRVRGLQRGIETSACVDIVRIEFLVELFTDVCWPHNAYPNVVVLSSTLSLTHSFYLLLLNWFYDSSIASSIARTNSLIKFLSSISWIKHELPRGEPKKTFWSRFLAIGFNALNQASCPHSSFIDIFPAARMCLSGVWILGCRVERRYLELERGQATYVIKSPVRSRLLESTMQA
jgi:hypothetical protein